MKHPLRHLIAQHPGKCLMAAVAAVFVAGLIWRLIVGPEAPHA